MVIINGALPGRLSEFNSYGNGRYIYISSPKLDEMGQNMTITENSLAHTFWVDINNTSVKNVIIAPQEPKPPPRPNVLPTKYKDA